MDEYLKANRAHWDEVTPHHERSEFYDVDGFRAGRCSLKSIELNELGDVSGKSLLHLQCHFGLDSLSWARLGAKVTGVDFSAEAITLARSLSRETGIEARFVESNIYNLAEMLEGKFDIVFTSWGVLCWLPDLPRWAEVIAHFLKPGGTFYMVEHHPSSHLFDDSADCTELRVALSYFPSPAPTRWEPTCGSYASGNATVTSPHYEWTHSLGEILTVLAAARLRIEFLHEFPVTAYRAFPFMERDTDGWWRLEGDRIPLTFSLRATRREP